MKRGRRCDQEQFDAARVREYDELGFSGSPDTSGILLEDERHAGPHREFVAVVIQDRYAFLAYGVVSRGSGRVPQVAPQFRSRDGGPRKDRVCCASREFEAHFRGFWRADF